MNITGGTALMNINETGGGDFDYITQVSGLTSGTEELRIGTIEISGDLGSGGGGTIAAQVISTLRIGGDLIADVVAGPRTASGTTTSAIEAIEASGNLTGDISVNYGYILELEVDGNIGSSGNNVTINAKEGIDSIIAGAIWANIDSQANSGSGSLYRLETTVGDFVGSLSTQFLTTKTGLSDPGLFIAGDLLAPITVDEDLRTFIDIEGDADANITITQQLRGRLRIGGSLLSGRTIACQALTESGVNGQVIINALNSSSTWSGSVTVNGTALATKPYYSNTGLGGAVGLAPFQCHLADCSPAHLATVTSWTPSTSTVTLRHYGPITWTGMPVTISKCNNWEDCDPNGTFVTDNWEAINSPSAGGRDLVLRLKSGQSLPADTHYHFFPVRTGTNMLKCADLMAGGNVPVADYMYEFVYDP